VASYQNELFWQTTAAEIAGMLRDPASVKPLFKVVMTPSKADVAGTAVVALIKIGKDAVPSLINALAARMQSSSNTPGEWRRKRRRCQILRARGGRPTWRDWRQTLLPPCSRHWTRRILKLHVQLSLAN